ncbi:MAG: DUF1080 domain-containing protein [Verrucomicrobiaceae bacterium]|nr:DUF1080 domain-containing protein [Verrucomicrobiaceae bacterium]
MTSFLAFALLPVVAKAQTEVKAPAPEVNELKIQGEYAGMMRDAGFGFQVIALGKGRYEAILCPGGLPGAGWTMDPPLRQRVTSTNQEGDVRFSGNGWVGLLKDERIMLEDFKGSTIGRLTRTERRSESLEAAPPQDAVVLFDGKSLDAFQSGARKTEDHLLMEGCTTKQEFGDCRVHLEFKLPFMPEAKGQGRGNSGIYLSSRYEVQILDSFGLRGEHNECGGIYMVAKPKVNMCYPPEQWQTYDIDFTAPRFDDKGAKLTNALITVIHNGVVIHDKVEVPNPTTASPLRDEGPTGPIHLQNHGNPVRFRNFWVVPLK